MPALAAPAALTLVVGSEDLLAERAVADVIRAARSLDPDTDIREVRATELTGPDLIEVLSPSLFGERRVLVVRGLGIGGAVDDSDDDEAPGPVVTGTLDAAVLALMIEHAANPDPEAHVVLVHRDANRGRAQLNALKKTKPMLRECRKLKGKAVNEFIAAEFGSLERAFTPDVPAALVLAVGQDLRALSSAVSQLVADHAGAGRIDRAAVEAFFAGRVEADAFSIADAVIDGRTPAALTLGRHAMAVGTGGPAITAALAYSFRSMVKASAAPRSGSLEDQAAAAGMKEWQLRKARQQLSGWTPEGVARAIRATAEADAAVKGAAVDSDYAIEQLIVRIGRARALR